MKIGRSTDHVTVVVSTQELAEIARTLGIGRVGDLCARGRLDPKHEVLMLYFGVEGRRFSCAHGSKDRWVLQLEPGATGAVTLEKFGVTPTTWRHAGGRRIDVQVPAVRAELVRRRAVIDKARPYVPTNRFHPGLKARETVAVKPEVPRSIFSEDELLKAQKIFNSAVERGYKPQFDARGRILFFEQRVGVE